jgi:hypothetical protein
VHSHAPLALLEPIASVVRLRQAASLAQLGSTAPEGKTELLALLDLRAKAVRQTAPFAQLEPSPQALHRPNALHAVLEALRRRLERSPAQLVPFNRLPTMSEQYAAVWVDYTGMPSGELVRNVSWGKWHQLVQSAVPAAKPVRLDQCPTVLEQLALLALLQPTRPILV